MSSIMNTLNIGYSALNAAQVGVDTTGHNIANAEVDGYTRQRVVTSAETPLSLAPGNVGNGVKVVEVKRVFDNFVFDRYSDISSDKEYSDYEERNLGELTTYFPEIDGVGVKSDLSDFYNKWQTFSDNPTNDSIKMAVTKQTETLSSHIVSLTDQVTDLQKQINDDLVVGVNEVNSLAKELANLNKSIDVAESGDTYTANDLRDKRNVIEVSLAKLIGSSANSGVINSDIKVDSISNKTTGSYSLNVGGFNIVDGTTYHPLKIENKDNENGFYSISYERQDGKLLPMEDVIKKGKVGAMLDLRGRTIDSTSSTPTDGIIQNTVDELNAFSKGLIESTNNLYAQAPATKMQSNVLDVGENDSLVKSSLNVKEGQFDLVVYNLDGEVAATRTINIDSATVMNGEKGSNSIEGQILNSQDDNENYNANDDIDDFFKDGFNYSRAADGSLRLDLSIEPSAETKGYSFAIKDVLKDGSFSSGTNFGGALGMNRLFDGDNATNIRLSDTLAEKPSLLTAGTTSVDGDNTLALSMMQHQFESFDAHVGDKKTYTATAYGMFDIIATGVGIASNSATTNNETISTQYNAIELEYNSTSKVSVDEEMTNLIKYQSSYSAAAKIITTVDQMMQTLLGIKQ